MEPETIIKQTLGDKYEIQSIIGKGGMATVYKAIQKSLNRPVAIKVIHQNLVHDEELVKRFIREAQVCASLDHSNIVTVYDVGSIGTIHFMSMEYLEGLTLRDLIKSKGNLSVEETSNNIIPIADALDYMHREGIIHRDVKSSNIFITKRGRVVLMDFGIVYSEGRESLSQYGTVLGTPEYMSPEQVEGRIKVDSRSDIYSLGVILFECLTGNLPFHNDNYLSTLHQVMYDVPPSVTSFNPEVPKWINSIVAACLVKDRNLRIQSGKYLAIALKEKQLIKSVYKKEENGTRKIELNNIRLENAILPKTNSAVKKKKNWILISLIASISILIVVILYLIFFSSVNIGKSLLPDNQNTSNLALGKQPLVNHTEKKSYKVSPDSNQIVTVTNKENDKLIQVLALVQEGDQYMVKSEPEKALSKYKEALQLAPANNQILKKIVDATNARDKKQQIADFNSKNKILRDIDGTVYKTVKIGNQVWMKENLKTTKFSDGKSIPLATDNKAWEELTGPGYCWYENNISNKQVYGALYNWYAVSTGKLCPTGWHVSTDAEWAALTTYLGGESVAANKLKETGTTHWISPNMSATNETDFTALPGGYRNLNGTYFTIGYSGYWWSSTETSSTLAWLRYLNYNNSNVSSYGYNKLYGFSVRCLRDN